LPAAMSIRIALHAGPVFEGTDAITGRTNFFGSHVNRTARIEPVTVPGQVYASQQFVALLTAEQRGEAEPPGGWPFTCEYLGRMNLAKNFGVLPVFSVRSRG
jgi:class 3 adenylate cyclase